MDADKNNENTENKENETTSKLNCGDNKVRWQVNLSVGTRPLNMVLDTGSQLTLIPVGLLKSDTMIKVTKRFNIIGISGTKNKFETIGLATGFIVVNGKSMSIDFQVVHDKFLKEDGILGMDFFKRYGALIDITEEKIIFQNLVTKMNEAEQSDICFEKKLVNQKSIPQIIEPKQENYQARRSKVVFLEKMNFEQDSLIREDSPQPKPNQRYWHGDNEAPNILVKKRHHKEHEPIDRKRRIAQGRNEIDHLSKNYLRKNREINQSNKSFVKRASSISEKELGDQKPAWAYERTNVGMPKKENDIFEKRSFRVRRANFSAGLLSVLKNEKCVRKIEKFALENFRVP